MIRPSQREEHDASIVNEFMARVTIIGIHPLDYDEALFDETVTRRHGLIALDLDRQRRDLANDSVRRELSAIVLVELVVLERDRQMYMGDFGQSGSATLGQSDPVAHGEVFLSADGTERVADWLDEAPTGDVRVAFFLHDYRAGLPILTSYGPVAPPLLTPMPVRLRILVPYRQA